MTKMGKKTLVIWLAQKQLETWETKTREIPKLLTDYTVSNKETTKYHYYHNSYIPNSNQHRYETNNKK